MLRYYGAKRDTDGDIRKARASAKAKGWRLDKYYPKNDETVYPTSINLCKLYKMEDCALGICVGVCSCEERDWPYDQGEMNSCTANALCAAYKLCLKKLSPADRFNPSRLFLYYKTREREHTIGKKDEGATLCNSIMAFHRVGVCEEKDWPYPKGKGNIDQPPLLKCYDHAGGNNLCEYYCLKQDISQFRACLIIDKCPFVFMFNVCERFDKATDRTRSHLMPTPYQNEKCVGKHAVMAVGYDDRKGHIIVQNSWGPNWGCGGYFYVPYALIERPDICFDFWKISFACRLNGPEPKNPTPRTQDACKSGCNKESNP